MKRIKFSTLVLIGIPCLIILFFTLYWHEPKYGTGIDTAAHFGRDAEYHLVKTDIYTLYDQVNRQVVEPSVYRYYYKNEIAYVEGVTGFSVIDVKQLQVQHYNTEEDLPTDILDIFKNKEFKEVEELRYNKFVCEKITTQDGGGIGNTDFYLGYDKEDIETKAFLNNNYELVVDEIKNAYGSRRFAEVNSINFHLEEILSEKFNVGIKDIQF